MLTDNIKPILLQKTLAVPLLKITLKNVKYTASDSFYPLPPRSQSCISGSATDQKGQVFLIELLYFN